MKIKPSTPEKHMNQSQQSWKTYEPTAAYLKNKQTYYSMLVRKTYYSIPERDAKSSHKIPKRDVKINHFIYLRDVKTNHIINLRDVNTNYIIYLRDMKIDHIIYLRDVKTNRRRENLTCSATWNICENQPQHSWDLDVI